jgi:hypothetical protein
MTLQGFKKTLAWSDFQKKKTAPIAGRAARTEADFSQNTPLVMKGGKVVIDASKLVVKIALDTTGTWVLTGEETDSLLNHEQRHYDIVALGARDFHADLIALEASDTADMQAKATKLNDATEALIASISKTYDDDPNCGTNHGKKDAMQAQWDLRIKNLMNNSSGRLSSLATCPAPATPTPTP